ncbi:hypothetical protein D187_007196 [Cystobacter fuscus DSM 2262]|uniref:Uncharacterized protein n=1 Tax=Cystobacter fuscus (strain ATCC 25194 / DSM 2262 / NBRC 100088 / M29) TaxID=1242864 RepID=S9P3C0_CYSF2|nr:hypothetical protein D187_007196 [Cystobacter fuscus DSM 2262]
MGSCLPILWGVDNPRLTPLGSPEGQEESVMRQLVTQAL